MTSHDYLSFKFKKMKKQHNWEYAAFGLKFILKQKQVIDFAIICIYQKIPTF